MWTGSNTITNLDLLDFDTTAAQTPVEGQLTWDAAQGTLAFGAANSIVTRIGQDLTAHVTNAESITINKGQVVYLSGAQGDRATVRLALNTGDATSARTLGVAAENIAAGQTGLVVCQGDIEGINMAAYTPGDVLYVGATAGSLTATKPQAPNHIVVVGTVARANSGNGKLYVRVQNGFELDEIHDVQINNPITGQILQYSGNVWINANVASGSGGVSTQYLQMDTTFFNNFGTTAATQINTTFTQLAAGAGGVTTSGNTMVFASGTYLIEADSLIHINAGSSTTANAYFFELYNSTGTASIAEFSTFRTGDASGPINFGVMRPNAVVFVAPAARTVILRHRVASGVTAVINYQGGVIKITKIA